MTGPATLLIACGALARELLALIEANGWRDMAVTCLPAHYHNTPEKIPEAVRAKIGESRGRYARIFVMYGDCGTGGALDRVLAEEGVARMPGPHCYEWFAGPDDFAAMMEEEPGTFFLTDYMVRHFDRLIVEGLWLDRHPELLQDYFGNYRKLVYLAQSDDADLAAKARAAAARLGLAYEHRFTGFGELPVHLRQVVAPTVVVSAPPAAAPAPAARPPAKRNLSLSRRRARRRAGAR
ncbi:MAG: DUF1638 domain-containing protein [Dongiaceae bacterium]